MTSGLFVFVFAGFTFTTGSASVVMVSSRSTVTVDALTVLVGPSALLDPETWSLSTSLDPAAADPAADSTLCADDDDDPDTDADDAEDAEDDDPVSPPDESDSAAATPWLAPSAMPAPTVTTHTPRNQRLELTDGM
ncbi:hypothetical protein [Mycolicibacterium hodleri]